MALIALTGPTASGKSALAMALAAHWPLEVVSIDSALVYRGLDIGSAKPSAAERLQVPHHLVDICDITQPYSAARCVADVATLAPQIAARGRIALLTGGTMLYLKALMEGLSALPPADADLRQALEARAATEGWPALHAQLQRLDPATAARLKPADSQRIQRALEVVMLTGQPMSDHHAQAPRQAALLAPTSVWSLEPTDRGWLHQRIDQRFAAMLQAGLVDEVRALQAVPQVNADLPAIRSVGYRQVWDSLSGSEAWDTLHARGVAATRQLAKRQLTWLRSFSARQVLDAQWVCDWLATAGPQQAPAAWPAPLQGLVAAMNSAQPWR